jgi:hypothetical protein
MRRKRIHAGSGQAGAGSGEDEADPVRRMPVFISALCSVPAPMPGSLLRVVLRQLRSLLSALDSIQAV